MKTVKKLLVTLFIIAIIFMPLMMLPYIQMKKVYAKKVTSDQKSSSEKYDIFFLKHEANFKKSIGDGVYFVPVNILGKPEYTNDEILDIIYQEKPEQIKKKINTLYDAIRYFYLSGFRVLRSDHKDIPYEGVIWQHHKTGKEALLSNKGDCSGSAVLISYLLEDDYDLTGFFSYNLPDGAGHVFNYFKKDGKYYFIDFSTIYDAIMEDSQVNWQGAYYLTNLVMADSIDKFVSFYRKNFLSNMTVIFNTYTADRVAPIAHKNKKYYLPDDLKKDIKFYGDTKSIPVTFLKRPKDIPSWNENGLINRDIKASVSVVPYSYNEYEGRGNHYDLRVYILNDITAELTDLTLSYYDSNNRLLEKNIYTKNDICRFQPNNCIFISKVFPLNIDNRYASIKGNAVFKDIHGNIIKKDFEYKMK